MLLTLLCQRPTALNLRLLQGLAWNEGTRGGPLLTELVVRKSPRVLPASAMFMSLPRSSGGAHFAQSVY